jgi:hypothetical protein
MSTKEYFINVKFVLFYFLKYSFFLIAFSVISGCGQECYTTPLQVKAKYENCADLGTTFSGRIGKPVWTFACTTSGNDAYADFIVKDGKYCRTYQHEF